jgi:hypothetical protein
MKINIKFSLFLFITITACAQISQQTIPPYSDSIGYPTIPESDVTPLSSSIPHTVVPFSKVTTKPPQPMFKFTPGGTVTPLPFSTQSLLEQARQDLADRLGIAVEGVEVVEVNQTELALQDWQCLMDSFAVELPAVVMGVEIWLRVDGSLYRYVGHGRQVRLCPQAGE